MFDLDGQRARKYNMASYEEGTANSMGFVDAVAKLVSKGVCRSWLLMYPCHTLTVFAFSREREREREREKGMRCAVNSTESWDSELWK